MNRIRVVLIATCLIAVTPRLSGDIILLSRLSDAEAYAVDAPAPQSQTGFLPANLCNSAGWETYFGPYANAGSTSNSSIFINNPMEGLRVVGDGTARATDHASRPGAEIDVNASAKLIVLSFTITEVSYPYSITGQLSGPGCPQPLPAISICEMATAKLIGDSGTIFEKVGTTLSETGTLSPGNYTLSVDIYAGRSSSQGDVSSGAIFSFALEGPMSTPTPTPTPGTRATNLSTRLLVGNDSSVGIGGFIVTGSGPRRLLLRGIGPSLGGVITGALPDPYLQLHNSSGCLWPVSNNNWRDTQEAEIIETGRVPSNDLESAIVADFAPGAYTATLEPWAVDLAPGVGLVEIFDLSTNQNSRLANISTRGNVGTGDNIMIAGFILGAGSGEDTVILRGLGPSLSGSGVDSALPDPKLELRDSQGGLIAANDNWMDDSSQVAIIQAAGLSPSNNLESAIAATLAPGAYTALLSGVNNGTGTGLVEVYDNPAIGPTPNPTPVEPATRTTSEVQDSVPFGHKNCMMLRDSAEW